MLVEFITLLDQDPRELSACAAALRCRLQTREPEREWTDIELDVLDVFGYSSEAAYSVVAESDDDIDAVVAIVDRLFSLLERAARV